MYAVTLTFSSSCDRSMKARTFLSCVNTYIILHRSKKVCNNLDIFLIIDFVSFWLDSAWQSIHWYVSIFVWIPLHSCMYHISTLHRINFLFNYFRCFNSTDSSIYHRWLSEGWVHGRQEVLQNQPGINIHIHWYTCWRFVYWYFSKQYYWNRSECVQPAVTMYIY